MVLNSIDIPKGELGITPLPESITVSVVIPFYNRIDLLTKALLSAKSQTHRNLEIILVNDGSTEPTDEFIQLIKTDQRISCYQQTNRGPAAARNLGISKATGKYIAFLDSDDLWEQDKIATQLAFMEENSLQFSYTNYRRISHSGEFLRGPALGSQSLIQTLYPSLMIECLIATPTVMILRKALSSQIFNENLRSGEDVLLWVNLAHDFKFGYLGTPLTQVRLVQSSHAVDPIKMCIGNLNIAMNLLNDPRHSQHSTYIAQLLMNTSYTLNPKLAELHLSSYKKIQILCALGWDRLKHFRNLALEKIQRLSKNR